MNKLMNFHAIRGLLLSMAATVLLAGSAATRAAETADAKQPPPHGLRIFTCGHSFHVFVYKALDEVARSAGIKGQELVGISRIGGSRVIQHWNVADEKNEAKKALEAGKVDVLTLSPIWLPEEGIEKFAKLGYEHNPNIRVTVQEFWLPNDTYEPKYPLDTRKKVDHDATDVRELEKNQARYDHDIDEYVRAINHQLGKNVIVTVPVGKAAVALRKKIVAGEAPGLKKQWDLFRDTWGHANAPLRVLSVYCHFAVIYQRSPVGLSVPSDLKSIKDISESDLEKLNRLLQELAWNAVTDDPTSGVSAQSTAP